MWFLIFDVMLVASADFEQLIFDRLRIPKIFNYNKS